MALRFFTEVCPLEQGVIERPGGVVFNTLITTDHCRSFDGVPGSWSVGKLSLERQILNIPNQEHKPKNHWSSESLTVGFGGWWATWMALVSCRLSLECSTRGFCCVLHLGGDETKRQLIPHQMSRCPSR